jgi:predicted DNA-binding protein
MRVSSKEKKADIHLRLPYEMYEKLKEIADKDDRTVSYIIRKILKEFIENLERKEVG